MLRVITYHRIGERSSRPHLDPLLVSAAPDVFRRHMQHLRRWYRPLALDEIVDAFESRRPLPRRSVHVTFDDAYRDFRELAWPILRELDIPVTVFVPTAYAEDASRSFWWDRLHRARIEDGGFLQTVRGAADELDVRLSVTARPAEVRSALRLLPHDKTERFVDRLGVSRPASPAVASSLSDVLGWEELRALQSEGVTFGTHTRNHVALSVVELERVREEIRRSLDDLARELGAGRRAIAYPYGMYSPAVARIADEEGCVLGFTCDDGLNRPGSTDPLRLCRSNITPRTSPAVFTIRMLPWCASVDRWRHRHARA